MERAAASSPDAYMAYIYNFCMAHHVASNQNFSSRSISFVILKRNDASEESLCLSLINITCTMHSMEVLTKVDHLRLNTSKREREETQRAKDILLMWAGSAGNNTHTQAAHSHTKIQKGAHSM